MSTLSTGGRIAVDLVDEETERLDALWKGPADATDSALTELLGEERLAEIDLFDRMQLAQVIGVCGESRSLSEAGRTLFSVSRGRKSSSNDADRLRKYLQRFGIDWAQLRGRQE